MTFQISDHWLKPRVNFADEPARSCVRGDQTEERTSAMEDRAKNMIRGGLSLVRKSIDAKNGLFS